MFQYSFTERTVPVPVSVPEKRFRRFRVPRSVPAKTVPTVPVSGSSSVPGPPCLEVLVAVPRALHRCRSRTCFDLPDQTHQVEEVPDIHGTCWYAPFRT